MSRQEHLTETTERKVRSGVEKIASRAGEAADSARDVAHHFGGALDRSLEREPMTTLAIAVGIGFVLGALWKA